MWVVTVERQHTCVMFHQLLECLKLGPSCDVITTVVQLPNLVVFDIVSLHIVPVPDRQGVGTFNIYRTSVSRGY